jgi:glycosyltransferase involved in cell wall biosynthesis
MLVSIINNAEDPPADWVFLKDKMNDGALNWHFHNAIPKTALEKAISKPSLARIRAAFNTARDAKKLNAQLIISHGPNVTFWTAIFCRLLNVKSQHLAFSFTFTKLPGKLKSYLMKYALRNVHKFASFSNVERELYSKYFAIPIDRFDYLPWTMDTPEFDESVVSESPYICAAGGEGRDYDTLVDAVKGLDVHLVIIARPENLQHRKLPQNVTLLTNVPLKKFWSAIKRSKFAVVPMLSKETNCGHGTIVGAFALDKPVVTTYSYATQDYAVNEYNSLISEPGDVKGLAENITRLWNDDVMCKEMSKNALKHYQENYDPVHAVNYIKSFLH